MGWARASARAPLVLGVATGNAWAAAIAALAAREWRRVQSWLQGLQAEAEPQTAEELLAYARRIETTSPGFAADLSAAALRHPWAALNGTRISLTAPEASPAAMPVRNSDHSLR